MGGVQECVGGQLTCDIVASREERIQMRSGAKGFICSWKQKWLRVLSAAKAVVGQTESDL